MKYLPLTTLVAATLLLAIFEVSHAKETTTEAWYVQVHGDAPYGSEHVTSTRLDDGNVEYRINSRMLLNLLGTRQEITSTANYVVTPEFQPMSLRVESRKRSGSSQIEGTKDGDSFHLRRSSNGLEREAVIDLRQHPIFGTLLPYYLAKLGGDAESLTAREITVPVIDEETLSVETARCELIEEQKGQARWSVKIGTSEVLSSGHVILRDGQRFGEESSMTRSRIRRSKRQEAEQLEHLQLTGRDILMFDVDQPIARPDRLESLTIELTWSGVPLGHFHLEDGRQSLVSHSVEEDIHRAIVRIAAPNASEDSGLETLPAGQRGPLLAKSRYIDPTDPDIVATARDWTDGSRAPEEAVTALAGRVFDHLSGGDLIAETLSGPEVLQCRKGKCSEYSTLFASLARSIGVPTRIVLGERMAGGQWVGHMWNEAWLDSQEGGETGRWITVDATTKEVGHAPGLLKFTHGATVLSTQPLRWELTDSLGISIRDFALVPESPIDGWETGIMGNTYTSAEFGFRVSAPADDWKIQPKAPGGQVVLRFRVPGEERVLIHGVAFSLPLPLPAKMMLGIRSTRFRTMYKDYEVLPTDNEKIQGRDWQTLQFTRAMGPRETERNPDGTRIKTTEYAWHRGKVGFLVNLIAEESAHDKHIGHLRQIVESMEMKPLAADGAEADRD